MGAGVATRGFSISHRQIDASGDGVEQLGDRFSRGLPQTAITRKKSTDSAQGLNEDLRQKFRLNQAWVRSHNAKESTCPTPGAVNEVKASGLPVVTMLRRVWAEVARDS